MNGCTDCILCRGIGAVIITNNPTVWMDCPHLIWKDAA